MADQYMLSELKNMAWQRLRSVLLRVGKPSPEWPLTSNLVALIHYVYKEIGASNEKKGEEPLRMLLSSFVALNFTTLLGSAIEKLTVSGDAADREFVVDLMAKVSQQMTHLDSKGASVERDSSLQSYD
ncbi:MAG: hypothetical protein Q9173_006193, partial [Seirophora scorigena]